MLPLFHYKCTFLPISRYVNIICKPSGGKSTRKIAKKQMPNSSQFYTH